MWGRTRTSTDLSAARRTGNPNLPTCLPSVVDDHETWGVTQPSFAVTITDQRRPAQKQILMTPLVRGMGPPQHVPHSPDSMDGWFPKKLSKNGIGALGVDSALPRHGGLSAGGVYVITLVRLRMEPRRPGDFLDREMIRSFRSVGGRPFGRAGSIRQRPGKNLNGHISRHFRDQISP